MPAKSPQPLPGFTTYELITNKELRKGLYTYLRDRFKNDPCFRWVIIGSSIYTVAHITRLDRFLFWPFTKFIELCYKNIRIPNSLVIWAGEIEPEVPFGRLGYTRCLESDNEVLEKFGVPMNTEKCLRDGFTFLPGEFYPQFDLNQYDPRVTPLTWTYGPIMDPSLIMPIGWYNDMSGENQEFELFCKYMRIFGYLPPEACTELYSYCKIKLLRSKQYLIKIGDPDDKVYIIIHGAVEIYSNRIGPHGDFIRIRTAMHGGQISSVFSIVDALSGYSRGISSIFAKCILDTTKILVFPVAALKDYLMRNQEYLVSSIMRLLEGGYRFQYQICHIAMQLTALATTFSVEGPGDDPQAEGELPKEDEDLTEEAQDNAIRSFMNFLGIDYFNFFKENCQVLVIEPEEPTNDLNVIKESILNKPETAYKYVYTGELEEFHLKPNLGPMDQAARRKHVEPMNVPEPLTQIIAGQGVGGLTGLLGYFNVLFYRCIKRAIIVTMDVYTLRKLLKAKPLVIFPIAYLIVYRMSPFIRSMDFAIEWTNAKEGQYIYHKEQMCYDSFLILSGRARAYQLDSEWHQRAILEYKENDWMGLIESLLQSKKRSKTCVVIRETEFVKIPNDLLRHILINYSSAAQVMLKFLVRRSLKSRNYEFLLQDLEMPTEGENYKESRRIRSVALIPVSENLPYSVLASEIKKQYENAGMHHDEAVDPQRVYRPSCTILTYNNTLEALRIDDITIKEQFLLEMYILSQLDKYDLIIFVCLPKMHYWNEISSCHSELMLTVGCSELPNIPTEPADFEEEIVGNKMSSRRKEIIILHRMDTVLPRNTKEWLHCRDWIHFHHHIRLPNEAFDLLGDLSEETIIQKYGKVLYREVDTDSDLARFLRWLQGKTFGVLFSSGGARIGAQLGMLQALVECKYIPIDMVVGTGAGFLLAALYAVYQDYAKVQKIIEKVFKDFNESLANLQWDDITFPYINIGNGKRLLTYFYQMFGSIQIEDTWIPICCVTTNLTLQDVRVDRNGPLWVYIRASLSHINFSPPICDPYDGDYICDGAHANSLPQDVLKEYGAEFIIALNTVGGKMDDVDNRADPNVSVVRFVKDSIRAFFKHIGLANPLWENVFNQLAMTQTRMYASGVEAVSNLKYVVYVRPPVEHLASQNWSNLPYLHRVGYFYMKAILEKNPYEPGMCFREFWRAIKDTSTEMASEEGRDLNSFITNIN